ncbi:peptidoglycan-binding protein [Thalassobacillus hwangdonensis]|uniref:Peptidoglycan-binding protein n=1 Tax=Thalassobacillus hwangdonensis TaxID=546108 RepID=A0ABW3L4M7_9BACI
MKGLKSFLFLATIFLTFHFSAQVILASTDSADQMKEEATEENQSESIEKNESDENEPEETEEGSESISDKEEIEEEEEVLSPLPTEDIEDAPAKTAEENESESSNLPTYEEKESTEEVVVEPKEEKAAEPASETVNTTMFSMQSSTSFRIGDRNEAISSFKEKLNAIGFGGIIISDYFGDFTARRVKEFQSNYGLTVDGIAGPATLSKLDTVYNSPYQQGNRATGIIQLKNQLNETSFGGIIVSDFYGSFTEQRVMELQSHLGMEPNGIADTVTRNELNQLVEQINASPSGFEQGDHHEDISDMKRKLNAIGFDGIIVSDYFGGFTAKQVEAFQENYRLEGTGVANEATLAKLNEIYNSPYQQGNRDSGISQMKESLNRTEFGGIIVSDLYGSFTAKRVKQLQNYFGMEANGIADELTRERLEQLVIELGHQQGDHHNDISEMKVMLNHIGFGGILVTDYFGGFTEKRVKQFQSYYGLPVNGRADQSTMDYLEEVYNSNSQAGKSHSDNLALKEKLNAIGFGGILVTKYFGAFTEQRVQEFQRFYGLKVNGIADHPTLTKMNEIYYSPLQKGKSHKSISSIKEDLNAIKYDGILVTDYFGSFTEKRLKEFQRDHELPVSGIADSRTIAELKEAVENYKVRIFLDPGHGAHDPGGQGYGLNEKDVVLDIALHTADILRERYTGHEVMLSRTNDTFVELEERSVIANDWKADYFVSIHTNAWLGKGRGYETYIHDESAGKEAIERRDDIHDYMIDRMDVIDRGKHEADFNVLRNTDMPAILLEYMFIDNYEENAKLRSSSYRRYLGEITAEAIARSFNLERK